MYLKAYASTYARFARTIQALFVRKPSIKEPTPGILLSVRRHFFHLTWFMCCSGEFARPFSLLVEFTSLGSSNCNSLYMLNVELSCSIFV